MAKKTTSSMKRVGNKSTARKMGTVSVFQKVRVVVIVDDDVEIDRKYSIDKSDEEGKEAKHTSLLPVLHFAQVYCFHAALQIGRAHV